MYRHLSYYNDSITYKVIFVNRFSKRKEQKGVKAMYINNINITISNNNKWLDKLVDSFNTPVLHGDLCKGLRPFPLSGSNFPPVESTENRFQ